MLHPVQDGACEVEHTDGRREMSRFPARISPHQPFMDVRALTHYPAGLRVRVEFENLGLRQAGARFRLEEPRPAADIQALHVAVVTETVERRVPFEFRDVTIR